MLMSGTVFTSIAPRPSAVGDASTEARQCITALLNLLDGMARAEHSSQAMQVALDEVRQCFGWVYGSVWLIDSAQRSGAPSIDRSQGALRYNLESGAVSETFRRCTRESTFAEGVGLNGRAWQRRELVFVRDLATVTDCVRAAPARASGVKSAVAFPIFLGEEIVGTMDFMSNEELAGSELFLLTMRGVASRVSSAYTRMSAQETTRAALATAVLKAVSAAGEGDLTQTLVEEGTGPEREMRQGMNFFLKKLRASITEISGATTQVTQSSGALASVSRDLTGTAQRSAEQATQVAGISQEVNRNIQTVTTSVGEMNLSIKEIAKSAASAAQVAQQAVSTAQRTNRAIGTLGDASADIGKVIKVITSIAQQTNLLALNATIEAARAGESGKGFAVVANEVKELAKETARATEEISQKIEAIQGGTRGAVAAIEEITGVINQVNDYSNTIAGAVEEQRASATEISLNLGEASRRSDEINAGVARMAAEAQRVRESADTAERRSAELTALARELRGLVDRFRC